ncbi:unnamed protein product [Clonostachys byssicola]|uniref:Heterokaryon incompatibility domain-containing protein n=1 Tax=Clonostachys byssicola TaxID=160290 RepID=A0A9N9Y0A9_9HYPO|nr:unnamed protein product [Clonostachys byssicola]
MAFHDLYPARLDVSKPEIRVLEIIDDSNNSHVSCKLHTVTLDSSSRYAALSYVWGDRNAMTEITVNDRRIAITRNLAGALRHARKYWKCLFSDGDPASFRIWADAICINQADSLERSEQVTLMPQIYSKAKLVLGWLGDQHSEDLAIATLTIGLIHGALASVWDDEQKLLQLEWLKNYPSLTVAPGCERRWRALRVLGSLPYWKRVWILQENLLATTMFYVTPTTMIEANTLLQACVGFGVLCELIAEHHVAKPDFVPNHVWLLFKPPEGTAFNGLKVIGRLGSTKQIFQGMPSHNPGTNQMMWEHLKQSQLGGVLQATDPKDHIYGLLGISCLDIQIDYSESKQLKDVYADYCRAVLQVLQQLPRRDIFFLRDAGIGVFDTAELDIPSWVPNYPARSTGDPPLMFRSTFHLSSMAPGIPFPSISGLELSISGVRLQNVKRIMQSPPTIENLQKGGDGHPWAMEYLQRKPMYNNIPSTWALFSAVARMPKFTRDTSNLLLLRDFLRFLDLKPPQDIEKWGNNPLQYTTEEEGGISIGIIMDGSISNPSMMAHVSPALSFTDPVQALKDRMVETTCRLILILDRNHHVKLFETGKELLGMGPQHCSEGDIVCAVDGYSDLVLLRKCGDRYKFVGPCSTFGISEESVKTALDEGALKVETFRLI